MNRPLNNWIIVLLMLFSAQVFAQEDTTDVYLIDEVILLDEALEKQAGFKASILELNRQKAGASLGQLLQEQSTIYIKSYGPGALSTTSFRGTGSNHTELSWYGMNLNSPSLGQSDFSTTSIQAFNRISLFHGAASMNNSIGGFGGSIVLENRITFQKQSSVKVNTGYGSFGQYNTGVLWQVGDVRFQSLTHLSFVAAENDFAYLNSMAPEEQREIQNNADTKQALWYQELAWNFSSKNQVYVRWWLQGNDRSIPQVISYPIQDASGEYQKDRNARSMIEWRHRIDSERKLIVRSAFLHQWMHYVDEDSNLSSVNKSNVWQQQIRYTDSHFKKIQWRAGLDWSNSSLVSDGFEEKQSEFRWHSFIAAETQHKGVSLHASLREVFYEGELKAVLPVFGLQYQFPNYQALELKANYSKNYRLPSFNDLYWSLGGNPDLNPEEGNSWEAGMVWTPFLANQQFSSEITYFNTLIDNWILWSPTNKGYWQAENARQVRSSGIETMLNWRFSKKEHQWRVQFGYSYLNTTNTKVASAFANALDKRLIYVPEHKWTNGWHYQYKKYALGIQVQHTGEVYIDRNNEVYMPDFTTGSFYVEKQIVLDEVALDVAFRIDNLTDVDYQVIANRPMPGRAFYVDVNIHFNNLKR